MSMIVRRMIGVAAAVALAGAFSGATLSAQELTKLRIAGPAPVLSATDSIIWHAIPTKLGYYKEEGLDVSYNLSPSLTGSAQSVQSGSAEFGVTNPEVVMQVREQGGSLTVFQTLRRANGNEVGVLPESPIQTLADLKGKTIGGVSWGGGGALFLTKVLAEMNIGLGDYSRVVTGNGPAAGAALRSKQVDAVILWDSAYAGLANGGVNLRYISIPGHEKLASNSFMATDAYLKNNQETVAKFCRAVAKSYYFARVNKEAAVKIFLDVNPTMRPASMPVEQAQRDYLNVFTAYIDGAAAGLPLEAKIGEIEDWSWTFTQNFYKGTGMLKGLQPPEASYTTAFTDRCNDFDRAKVAAAARAYK